MEIAISRSRRDLDAISTRSRRTALLLAEVGGRGEGGGRGAILGGHGGGRGGALMRAGGKTTTFERGRPSRLASWSAMRSGSSSAFFSFSALGSIWRV